ncbi:MAG: DinB family protein [Anaerolineaceae bacterium]|nr:DinB family protein [Anaerolineaceae bacterium]
MDNLLQHLQAILQTTPARWNALVQTVPEELLTRKPAPAEWSALECLQHLVDVEKWVFPVRVRAFLAGEKVLPAFDPDKQPPSDLSATALAAEYAALRAESLSLLATVTEADLARQSRHAELGDVTLGEMLHEWAAHDLAHTVQAEQAMMQPFIAGCGAWQMYFTAHVAKQS